MQQIAIASDLHLEFTHGNFFLPELNNEKATILILAGDIVTAKKVHLYEDFFEDISNRFKSVIYVMGNHEHYKWNFLITKDRLNEFLLKHGIIILDNEVIKINGIIFVGSTLWSNIPDEDYSYCRSSMNDYDLISYGGGSFTPFDSNKAHKQSKEFLLKNIEPEEKTVVITHHAPSFKSVNSIYLGNRLNCAYASDLEDMIILLKPEVWIHGHMHTPVEYSIGATKILSNPHGYPNENIYPYKLKTFSL